VVLAVAEVEPHDELRQQGVLDAEQHFVGDRRAEVGVHRVRLQDAEVEGVDVAAGRRHLRADGTPREDRRAVVGGVEVAVAKPAHGVERAG
jgi:hypothetical protein